MKQALRYANVMSRLVDAPLWAHPVKAAVLYNALCGRFGTAPVTIPDSPELSRFVGEWPTSSDEGNGRHSSEPFRLTNHGVGIVTVTGTLVTRGAWVGSHSGVTSYEGIKHQVNRAAADSRVKSIILDLDTPGGEANGAFEAAQAVRSAAASKPVVAVANGMAASAGYALASGASKIISTPSGVSGSIGCVLVHLDYSRALAQEGISPTLIVAGARKLDGNSLEPLDDESLATLREEVNRYYELFLETVAAGRGRATPASIARNTEGRTYIGREAVSARLADDVGTFEDVLSDLTRRARRTPPSSVKLEARRAAVDPLFEDDEKKPFPEVKLDEEQFVKLLGEHGPEGAGEARQLARIKAIAADERVRGKLEFAIKLAVEAPNLTSDQIGALCSDLPAAAQQRLSFAERERETGADAISSTPLPRQDSRQEAHKAGWDAAVARTNTRTLTEIKKGASRNA